MKATLQCTIVAALFLVCSGCIGDSPERMREAALKEDLYSIRQAIDQFAQELGRAPESLEDLVEHGYLHEIPTDPFTNSRLTWQVVYGEPSDAPQDTPATPPAKTLKPKGIIDVHSGSNLIASDGTDYSDW